MSLNRTWSSGDTEHWVNRHGPNMSDSSRRKGQEHGSAGAKGRRAPTCTESAGQGRRRPLGSLGWAEHPVGLCLASPGPDGRDFLKGFCREMGQRKEERAVGGPPDHGCACAAHEYFSGHLFIPAPSSCWGHRPVVDKYSHRAINEASAPREPHPLGPWFPQPAGWAPCPAQLVSDFH